MPYSVREIKKYIIRVCYGGGEYHAGPHSVPLAIGLYGDQHEGAIASLHFHNDLSRSRRDPFDLVEGIGFNDSAVACNLPADKYPRILDLLKNEQPLFFHFDSDSTSVLITTSEGPAGKHEMIPGMVIRRKARKKRNIGKNDLFSPEPHPVFIPAPPVPETMA